MTRRVRVSNLTATAHGRHVAMLFAFHGEVRGVEILTDPASRSRGTAVAVVEMSSDQQGEASVAALDGRMYCGRNLEVRWEAFPGDAGPAPMSGPTNTPEGPGPQQPRGPGGTHFEMDEAAGEAKAVTAEANVVIAEAGAAIMETESRTRRDATGGARPPPGWTPAAPVAGEQIRSGEPPEEKKVMTGKFPLSNFGPLGGGLRRFADRDGNVPENGAGFGSMNYHPTWTPGEEEWDEFVAEAAEATDEAEETQRIYAGGG